MPATQRQPETVVIARLLAQPQRFKFTQVINLVLAALQQRGVSYDAAFRDVIPSDRTAPLRAIADGELLAYRYDETDATDAYFDKAPYSRSFVLLKHKTKLGQTTFGTATLTFYSLYMHLHAWAQVKGKTSANAINFLRKPGAKAHLECVAPSADGACHGGSAMRAFSVVASWATAAVSRTI
ncbi:hypothetical protein [Massilia sp. PWRC2]|uniref:hypothetical protein n=1 Tax=Massilia sp. PWRC2 TaxID=2804626 RepID=UPI003CE7A719